LKKKFSVVIPVLNEEKNISKLINSIKINLTNINYEIILVDDQSSDNTAIEIKKYTNKKIRYFLKRLKKDLTKSLIIGIKKSKYDIIIIMDSDLQHNPKYLPKMINMFNKNNSDFVVGVRDLKNNIGLSKLRLAASKTLCFIFNFFLGYKVSDPMSGFVIFKKSIFYKYESKLFGIGWKFLVDLIYNDQKFKINEYKIKFDKRIYNESKISFKVLINIIKLFLYKFYLLKIKFRLNHISL
jgi:dolichol-phosphate mannosyltransferase